MDFMSILQKKSISMLSDESNSEISVSYTLEEPCPLTESQLNVYLDIVANDKMDSYRIPMNISVPREYGVDQLLDALDEMFKVHPILEMRVSEESDVPCLVKGNKPSVFIKSSVDEEFGLKFINEPFDLNDSLCRFLILYDDEQCNLFCVFHHLIFDGLSSSVFERNLLEILKGNSLDVDDSFLKAAAFNSQIYEITEFNDAETFYEAMLADIDEAGILLESVDGDGYGVYSLDLEVDPDEFLEKFPISKNILFTSVFAYTLSRFEGNNKVLFNIVENGRDRFDNFNAIGMFVNTLPLLVDCKNQEILSFISHVSDLIHGIRKYNYYPFRLLANEYDVNSHIIFQYRPDWFIDDDITFIDNTFEKLVRGCEIHERNDLISDFSADVTKRGNSYTLNITYSEKFSRDFINNFATSYKLICHGIISLNELSQINYITSSDLELLDGLNRTEHSMQYGDILDSFNDNLSKYPNNNLVTYMDRHFSYSQGAYIADKIAKKLSSFGVRQHNRVAFLLQRSENYIFSILAIMSMGAVYVPLDDKHPDERLQFILDDTDSKVVIVSDDTCNRARNFSDIAMLNISDILYEGMGNLFKLPVVYSDLACILYTSGTTGIPKGVKITRKSVLNLATFYQDEYCLGNEDTYGMFSNIGFDAALLAMMTVLYSGTCLSIVPNDIRLDINAMNDYFIEHNVTHSLITSQVGKLFMKHVKETSLNVLLVGGEKLGDFESPTDYVLVDAFGPTETCVFISSIKNVDKIDSSSIGYLGYNTKGYILDDEKRRVPMGGVGELYVSGIPVSDGYLNREEENAQAFFDNPFDDGEDYRVLYRTGDMVRMLPDGSLSIVGRRDSQVKIRGNRVELSEIELVIHEIDFIQDVSVQTVKNGENNEIVAYVVADTDKNDKQLSDFICEYVGKQKPDFMVPSFVVKLDAIPLNVNGKVDKRALPEVNRSSLRAEYLAPSTKDEKLIVKAFERVFNQKRISLDDDFIRLGGDSLTAIKLLSHLSDYNFTAADILTLRTPIAMAGSIRQFTFDVDVYSLESGCPLNEPQLNVYLDIMANNKTDSYLIPLNITIPCRYDVESLVDALDEMFSIHPILHMKISDEFNVPYLVKGNRPSIYIKSGVSEEFGCNFISKPFDFDDSLCRFLILKNEENYNLFAVFHHLIFDGLSASVFEHDLFKVLDEKFIDLDDSFLKVSAFSQQVCEIDEFEIADSFYESMLADVDEAGVLLDSICADGPGTYSLDLDIDIGEFLDKYSISENVLFTSVFAYTLSRFVGNDKVFFNTVENGRDRFNNFNSIGMFVNTLPLFVDCKNRDVESFMDYMSDLVYGVMGYNYYPFILLTKKYDLHSDIIFQFKPDWFIRDDVTFIENTFDKLVKKELVEDMNDFICDFNVDVSQREDDYSLNIIYSDKFSKDWIESFSKSFKLVLHDMINVEELSEINYTLSSDLKLLDNLNETDFPLKYGDILDAFNENLARCPSNILVSFQDRHYTYTEGAFIADRIATRLIDLGIKKNDNVAFLTERCEYYMFAVLGILSIGAAYVPLDDNHPDERIGFIVQDTDAKVVIVSDETSNRARNLFKNSIILNVSDILEDDIGTLSKLNVSYGDVASIIYTSGSTGIPKGVKVTRNAIFNVAAYYTDTYGLDSHDVYGMYPSVGFDAGCECIFKAIYAGCCLSIVPEDVRYDMVKLNEYFINHNVTHTMITTQVGKLFMEVVEDTSLEYLFVGGEKLGEVESPANYILVDEYGPSETNNFIFSIDNSHKIDYSSVGHLNYNCKAYILDDEFRRVPVGGIGELYLAGLQVSQGYLNRDEETEKAFLNNPFDDNPDYNVIYRTGDIARFLPDKTLGIIGRNDGQVKIRGNRVELSEIESIIREMDFIKDVTVQTIKHDSNKELVAYVVISEELDENDFRDDIRAYISKHKPDYMVPSFMVKLDEIPLNVNGKVDKRALPKVDTSNLSGEYMAPENDVEQFFVKSFEKILGIDNVSAIDNFFEIGGDSLLVMKIIFEATREGYFISYADVFDNPTPKLLSKIVLSTLSSEDGGDDYDYALIDKLLEKNNIDSFINGECNDSLGNILLLGVTGFLGIHILYELLESENGDIFCFIRPKEGLSIEDRLDDLLNHYFKCGYADLEDRVHLIEGDITNHEDFEKLLSYEIDTVINCAANVKHFSQGTEILDINYYGVLNVLDFVKAKDAKLIQISTDSVAGAYVDGLDNDIELYENQLFIGQDISNKYVESKFLAERAILEAVINHDIDVKIMRVGNLMARSYDGKFQRNYKTNAFVNRLRALTIIGKMSESISQQELEFCPIDLTAKAIVLLAKTPKDCVIFHPFTDKHVIFKNLVPVFDKLNLNVEFCSDEEYNQILNKFLKDKSKQEDVFSLITYSDNEGTQSEFISANNDYTSDVLSYLGFEWSQTSEKYLFEFMNFLYGLDFFKS